MVARSGVSAGRLVCLLLSRVTMLKKKSFQLLRRKECRFLVLVAVCFAVALCIALWPKEDGARPAEASVTDYQPRLRLPPPKPPAPRQDGANGTRLHFRYVYMLADMGFSAPRPHSVAEKAELERFFSSARHFVMAARERAVTVDLLRAFHAFCRQENLTFFLNYGGLLGAFRHHGFIPWDDDIDVMMPIEDKPTLLVLLKDHPTLSATEKKAFVVLVYFRDPQKSLPSVGRAWGWPFIEVHFYEQSRGHLLHMFENCGSTAREDFFPLVHVPFEGLLVPAPRCMDRMVLDCYPRADVRCCTNMYDHRQDTETRRGGRCVPCRLLARIFPFVTSRRRSGDSSVEEVRLGDKSVARRTVRKPVCPPTRR